MRGKETANEQTRADVSQFSTCFLLGGVERNTTVKASVSKQVYSYWIPDLQVFTCYSIRLSARNSKGLGK